MNAHSRASLHFRQRVNSKIQWMIAIGSARHWHGISTLWLFCEVQVRTKSSACVWIVHYMMCEQCNTSRTFDGVESSRRDFSARQCRCLLWQPKVSGEKEKNRVRVVTLLFSCGGRWRRNCVVIETQHQRSKEFPNKWVWCQRQPNGTSKINIIQTHTHTYTACRRRSLERESCCVHSPQTHNHSPIRDACTESAVDTGDDKYSIFQRNYAHLADDGQFHGAPRVSCPVH